MKAGTHIDGGNGSHGDDYHMHITANFTPQKACLLLEDYSYYSDGEALRVNNADSNGNGATHTNFLWAPIKGYSKFGVYTGNNSNDGNYVHLGFRPAWLMVKDSASGQSWHVIDSKREPGNDDDAAHLIPNSSNTEAQAKSNRGTAKIDFLANGFKIRSDGSLLNGTGTMIYMAFAEAPFVNSNGVPANAR